jgi:hypothetical protein
MARRIHGGLRDALIGAGRVLVAAALAGTLLRHHDTTEAVDPRTPELLRSAPLLGWLPSVGLERLASRLVPVELAAGAVLLREGEAGDRA